MLDKVLSEQKSDYYEGMVTLDEATKALNLMANNRSPGSDGLNKEFYAKVWTLLGQYLVDVFNSL